MERGADLSVVIPSVNGWGDLEGCLRALMEQDGEVEVEVLVADRVGETVRARVRQRWPGVRILEASADATIPALRAMAFRAATADVVGVIEDHVIVPRDWAVRMLGAQAEGWPVVGGAVANAADRTLVDRAAFLCEYSRCLVPPEGPADWLTGNNVTYRREVLERFRDVTGGDAWEDRLHDAMRAAGITLLSRPDIVVEHRKHYTIREYLQQRYLYARSYAGGRARGSLGRRVLYGGGSLVLPPVLLWRVVGRAVRAGVPSWDLVASAPLLTLFVVAWAGGEAVGSLFGPGNALQRVC